MYTGGFSISKKIDKLKLTIVKGQFRVQQVASLNRPWFWWSLVLLFLFFEAAWLVFLAPTDVARYQCYASSFWFGGQTSTLLPQAQCSFLHLKPTQPPFQLLPLEYPPFTLVLFSLPLLVPLPYYTLTFALLMSLTASGVFLLLDRYGLANAKWLFSLLFVLGASTVFQVRYDLVPALCTLVCIIAAERNHWTWAYILLALGILLKLYPLVMLPALFIAEQQMRSEESWNLRTLLKWRWKNLLICLGLVILVTLLFGLTNFQGAVVSPIVWFAQRPIQIETVQSSLLWAVRFIGFPFGASFSSGSLNIISPLAGIVSPIGTALTVLGTLWVFWLQIRQKITLIRAFVALVCVLLLTGKVFSPQYLIWLFPLLAYAGIPTRTSLFVWGGIALLTTLIYLVYYTQIPDPTTAAQVILTLPGFFEAIAVRNVLFLFAALSYIFNWFHFRNLSLQNLSDPSTQVL